MRLVTKILLAVAVLSCAALTEVVAAIPTATIHLPGYSCDTLGMTQLADDKVSLIACLKTSKTNSALVWKSMMSAQSRQWYDVSSKRGAGSSYVNNTGQEIDVTMLVNYEGKAGWLGGKFEIDGVYIPAMWSSSSSSYADDSPRFTASERYDVTIPQGGSYRFIDGAQFAGAIPHTLLFSWLELRTTPP